MSILCLWSPAWRTDEASVAERIPLILEEAPRVVAEERGVIWVDVRGMAAGAVARRLVRKLAERGEGEVRGGISGSPIAAEGVARAGEPGEVRVVERGEEGEALEDCPLQLLTTDDRLLAMLAGVGVRRCGDLAGISAEAAEVRFGAEGARLSRLARGEDSRLLFRPIPPERPQGSVDFVDYSVRDATRLVFTLNAILEQVCDELLARARRARSLTLTFTLSGGGTVEEILRTARPTADRVLWLRRIRVVLERIKLRDTIVGVSLTADALEPISAVQGDLFDRGFATASFVEEAVGRLVDLYRGLFSRQETSGHPLAERRTRWIDLAPQEAAETKKSAELTSSESREPATLAALHLQLLTEPRPIGVRTRTRRDHTLPVRYQETTAPQAWHSLDSAGPDRISGGHDETRPYAREYYRCVSDAGALLWIFRDAMEDRWYLHGWWD